MLLRLRRTQGVGAALSLGLLGTSQMCRAAQLSSGPKSLYGLASTKIDGSTYPMSNMEGKCGIIVNVASR